MSLPSGKHADGPQRDGADHAVSSFCKQHPENFISFSFTLHILCLSLPSRPFTRHSRMLYLLTIFLSLVTVTNAQNCWDWESCSTCSGKTMTQSYPYPSTQVPCLWCQGNEYGNVYASCQEASQYTCPPGTTEVTTCPSAPSPVSTALTRSSPLLLLIGSLCAVIILGVSTFSPLELTCGKKSMSSPTPQGASALHKYPASLCSVCTLFMGTFFLWFSLALLLASPSLPWLMHTSVPISSSQFSFQYATAFAQYNCYPFQDRTSTAHMCTETVGTDNVKEYSSQGEYTDYINNGFILAVLC
jgi:hypothetical protein